MTIPKRIAKIIISSLKGGVVPRIGLPYIAVGRKREVEALLHDIEMVDAGGASFRFIEGKYGAGKSFLIQSVRNFAMDRGFVVCDADLSPERRLMGTQGQGLSTYRELIGNLSVKTKPEGGALTMVLDRWISSVQEQGQDAIMSMNEMVGGFDFAKVMMLYYKAFLNGNEMQKACALKWLRGEYQTKTEAKNEIGVASIISDENWYEYLKIFAGFFKKAGYNGMLVFIDELVNIYKIPNSITRQYNYEKILTMYNDAMQGKAHCLGTVLCGTPQAIEDTRRGVFSYEALRSRLSDGKFSVDGMTDMLSPVIHLEALTAEELLVLCEKLAEIHAALYDYQKSVTDEDLATFIKIEFSRIGAARQITPREVIRDFIELLDIVVQNPSASVKEILSSEKFSFATAEGNPDSFDENFLEFKI